MNDAPETRRCPVCTRALPEQTGRGRRYTACPPPVGPDRSVCGRIDARLSELDTLISTLLAEIEGEPDEAARVYLQGIKSHLWRELNVLTNRGRLLSRPNRSVYEKARGGWWRAQKNDVADAALPPKLLAFRLRARERARLRGAVAAHVLAIGTARVRDLIRAFPASPPKNVRAAASYLAKTGQITRVHPGVYTADVARRALTEYARDMLTSLSFRVLPARRANVVAVVKAVTEIVSVHQDASVLILTVTDGAAAQAVVATLQPPVPITVIPVPVDVDPELVEPPADSPAESPVVEAPAEAKAAFAPVVALIPAPPAEEDPDLSACTRDFVARFALKPRRLAFAGQITGSVIFAEPPFSEEASDAGPVYVLCGKCDPEKSKALRDAVKDFDGKIKIG